MNPNTVSVNQAEPPFRSLGVPPEGSEGLLPLPTHASDDAANMDTEKPSRAGQIGEGSYEGTDGYAKSVSAYLRSADVGKDAEAAAPHTPAEARELLEAESEGASRSKAPGK